MPSEHRHSATPAKPRSPDPRHATPVADEDPRKNPHCVTRVPTLLRQGADHYNARRYWHAHEAWEEAWHSLRAHQETDQAAYVRGMILTTAALENATRNKEPGFKRQMAEALHALLTHNFAAAKLGVVDAAQWHEELTRLYVDACRRRKWEWWNESGWSAPTLELAKAEEP